MSEISHALDHLHSSCLIFEYTFSSVLYFGINSSCSSKITQISHTFEKSNHVVIIFVQIIISAFSRFFSAKLFSVLFFTVSVSKRKILEFLNSFLIESSICCVQIHTFCKVSLEHFLHFLGISFTVLHT